MNNRRKILIAVLSIILIAVATIAVTVLRLSDKGDGNSGNKITRSQWIETLGSYFGMNECQTETPYYSDISSSDSSFAFIQSCYEWGILDNSSAEFKPGDLATTEFVIKTAIYASGIDYTPLVVQETEEQNLFTYAAENKLIADTDEKTLKQNITEDRLYEVLDWALRTYHNKEFVEYSNVEMNDKVQDFTALSEDKIEVAGNLITMDKDQAVDLKVDSVFLTPGTQENPLGEAKKVVSITYEDDNAVIETITPELGEIYNEFAFAAEVAPEIDDIIPQEGVTVTQSGSLDGMSVDQNYRAGFLGDLGSSQSNNQVKSVSNKKGLNFGFNVSLKKYSGKTVELAAGPSKDTDVGKIAGSFFTGGKTMPKDFSDLLNNSNATCDLKSDIEAFKNNKKGFTKNLTADLKFKSGYEITGEVKFSNFYVDFECITKKVLNIPYGIEKITAIVNYDFESSLSIKGALSGELKVGDTFIPVGPSGVLIHIEFLLYTDANGELKVKYTLSNNTIAEYNKGKFKKTSLQDETCEGSIAVKIQAGPKVKATIQFYNVKLVDVDLKVGISAEFEVKEIGTVTELEANNETTITKEIAFQGTIDMYAPIIILSIGQNPDSLANKFGLKFKWTICDKEGKGGLLTAAKIPIYESEPWVVWQSVETIKTKDGNADRTDNYLSIDSYALFIEKGSQVQVVITEIPKDYESSELVYTSQDNNIVSVDAAGNVLGIGGGSTVITVSTKDNKFSVSCSVTVSDPESNDSNDGSSGGGSSGDGSGGGGGGGF